MFLLKSHTQILIESPKSKNYFYWSAWMPYITKEEKIYEKEEVWDFVALQNNRADIQEWAHHYINNGKTVICRNGKYALVNSVDLQYLD